VAEKSDKGEPRFMPSLNAPTRTEKQQEHLGGKTRHVLKKERKMNACITGKLEKVDLVCLGNLDRSPIAWRHKITTRLRGEGSVGTPKATGRPYE